MFGELLLTVGVVVLLFAAYELYGVPAQVAAVQSELNDELEQQWQQPEPAPAAAAQQPQQQPDAPLERGLARLHIPRLGKSWVVVEGVTDSALRRGPGHYPRSQQPGELGNFAVAGHRQRSVFWDLDLLRVDDAVIVETRQSWFVYRVYQSFTVSPTASSVLDPVPQQPREQPTRAVLTLTTCHPKFDNYQRLIVHGLLSRQQARGSARPAELGG